MKSKFVQKFVSTLGVCVMVLGSLTPSGIALADGLTKTNQETSGVESSVKTESTDEAPDVGNLIDVDAEVDKVKSGLREDNESEAKAIANKATTDEQKAAVDRTKASMGDNSVLNKAFDNPVVIDGGRLTVVLPADGMGEDIVRSMAESMRDQLESQESKDLAEKLGSSDLADFGVDQLSIEYMSISSQAETDWIEMVTRLKESVQFDEWSSDLQELFVSGNAVTTARYEGKDLNFDSDAVRELVRVYSGEIVDQIPVADREVIFNEEGYEKFKDVEYVDLTNDAKVLGEMIDARGKGASLEDLDAMALNLTTLREDKRKAIEASGVKVKKNPVAGLISNFFVGVSANAADVQDGWDGSVGSNDDGGKGGYTSKWTQKMYSIYGSSAEGSSFVLLPDGYYYPAFCIDTADTGVNTGKVNVGPVRLSDDYVRYEMRQLLSTDPKKVRDIFDFFYFAATGYGIAIGTKTPGNQKDLDAYAANADRISGYWNALRFQIVNNGWDIWKKWTDDTVNHNVYNTAVNAKSKVPAMKNQSATHTFNKPGEEWDSGIKDPGVPVKSGHANYDLFIKNGNIWVRAKAPTTGNTLQSVIDIKVGLSSAYDNVYVTSGGGQTRVVPLSHYTNPYKITINVKVNGYVRLRLNKSDKDPNFTGNASGQYSLAGAQYGVYSDAAATNLLETLTVGTDGYTGYTSASRKFNADSTVYVKETKAPKGYVLDPKVYAVKLSLSGNPDANGDFSNTYNVSDAPQGLSIAIKKVSSVHGDSIPGTVEGYSLAGAEFSIEGIEGNTTPKFTVVTDASGKVNTGKLALGKYRVKEVKAPAGFVLDSAWESIVEVTSDNPGTSTVEIIRAKEVVKENVPIYGETWLEKRDAETGRYPQGKATLEGAEYTLFDASTGKPVSLTSGVNGDNIKAVAGKLVSDSEVVMTTTGAIGKGYFVGVTGLYMDSYYWQETKAPEGYNIDTTKHPVVIKDAGGNNTVVRADDVISYDKVITGLVRGQKIKMGGGTGLDDPDNSPLIGIRVLVTSKTTGKTYRAIVKEDGTIEGIDVNTGNETSNPYNDSPYTTNNTTNLTEWRDAGGVKVAVFEIKGLPYDDYVVSEDDGTLPEGFDIFDPTDVRIRKEGQINDIDMNDNGMIAIDKRLNRKLLIRKLDEETGQPIHYKGATFKIWDTAKTYSKKLGKIVDVEGATPGWVEQYDAKTGGKISQWMTDSEGYIKLDDSLDYGVNRYELHEITPPVGYGLHDKVIFSIDLPSSIKDTDTVMVTFKDPAVKGLVQLTKFFEGIENVTTTDTEYGPQHKFSWDYNSFLDGAAFEVRATEDISPFNHPDILKNIPGGKDSTLYKNSIRYKKGQVITTLKPDGITGVAKSDKNLYVGRYSLVEVKAPVGYELDTTPIDFEIKYDGDTYTAVNSALEARNARMGSTVIVEKDKQEITDIKDDGTLTFELVDAPNVVFGMFATEAFNNAKGVEVVPVDGLLEILTTDDKGAASASGIYPDGAYYLKELKVDEPWIMASQKYHFNIKMTDNKDQIVKVFANGFTLDDKYKVPATGTVTDEQAKAIAKFNVERNRDDVINFNEMYARAALQATSESGLESIVNFRMTPEIGTSAEWDTGSKEVENDGVHTLIDTVSYANLVPGREYEIKGLVMDRDTNKPLINSETDKPYESSVKFTPTEANAAKGVVMVTFEINTKDLAKQTLVVFEDLYEEGKRIGFHHDIKDHAQSVRVVEMYSDLITGIDAEFDIANPDNLEELLGLVSDSSNVLAEEGKSQRFVDLFYFNGLGFIPSKEYEINYKLMRRVYETKDSDDAEKSDKKDDSRKYTLEPAMNGDTPIEGRLTFDPSLWVHPKAAAGTPKDQLNGVVPVGFTLDNVADFEGEELTIVAEIMHNGKVLVNHNNVGSDERETMYVPEIGTSLVDDEGTKYPSVIKDVVLHDTISYKGLQPGREYVAKGKLMDQETGEVMVDEEGKEITATTTFTPEVSEGTVVVTFEFKAVNLAGKTGVAFEEVYDEERLVAVHADIEDEAQSIYFPEMGTKLTGTEGAKHILADGTVLLTDTITYKNFRPGTYKFKGQLYVRTLDTEDDVKDPSDKEEEDTDTSDSESTDETESTEESSTEDSSTDTSVEAMGDVESDSSESKEDETMESTEPEDATDSTDMEELVPAEPVKGAKYKVEAAKDANGELITGETLVEIKETNGEVDVTFEYKGDNLKGEVLVAFEDAILITKDKDDKEIETPYSEHKDPADEGQTIYHPEIGTSLVDDNGTKYPTVLQDVVLHDTVKFKNLHVGREHTVNGTLMDKETGKPMLDESGNEIKATTVFTPETSEGEVVVTFTFKGVNLSGKTGVAFEEMFDGDRLVGVHADIEDEAQTVYFPEMGTKLTGVDGIKHIMADGKVKLTDTITYKNFLPGKYVFKGQLMVRTVDGEIADMKPIKPNAPKEDATESTDMKELEPAETVTESTDMVSINPQDAETEESTTESTEMESLVPAESGKDESTTESTEMETINPAEPIGKPNYKVEPAKDAKGQLITGETVIEITEPNGEVDVTFEYDGSNLKGEVLVAYEEAILMGDESSEKPYSEHKDPADEGQTIYHPEIGTTLTDDEGSKYPSVLKDVVLKDTIKYSNLVVGTEYVAKGKLMDKETNKPLLDDKGKEILAEAKFTPESTEGEVVVTFEFKGVTLAGKTVVAFEEVYDGDRLVAVHTDIDDENQTVYFPAMGTTLTGKDGKSKEGSNDSKLVLVDTIDYSNFPVGSDVKFVGKLMVKPSDKAVDTPNKETKVYRTTEPNVFDSKVVYVDENKASSEGKREVESMTYAQAEDKGYKLAKGEKLPVTKGDVKSSIVKKDNFEVAKDAQGKEITAEAVVKIKEATGKAEVVFEFDASKMTTQDVVAFEEAFELVKDADGKVTEREITNHKDINDKGQTFRITKPNVPIAKFGGNTHVAPMIVLIIGLMIIVGGLVLAYVRRRNFEA